MWIIFVIAIVGYIIYQINKDYNHSVKTGVTNQGGMLQKYSLLIEYFTANSLKVTKVSKSSVTVTTPTMTIWIDYVDGATDVSLKGLVPIAGNISKKWNFPRGYPQEKMIEEIENYLNWQMDNIKKISGNDYGQYINYE